MSLRLLTLTIVLLAFLVAACGSDVETTQTAQSQSHNKEHAAAAAPQAQAAANVVSGEVLETMDTDKYTYVRLEHGGETIWAAGPKTEMAVGNEVVVSRQMPMPNFHSKSLDRTFEVVYFVTGFGGDSQAMGHGGGMGGKMAAGEHPEPAPAADVDLSGIERVDGGRTVAEIHAASADLSGQTVRFVGKVVKYNGGIMGRNWLHVRDGSGAEGTNDLTVTTQGFAQVGDLVLVEGTVATDRDFGAGYKYDVIVEQATVTKQ